MIWRGNESAAGSQTHDPAALLLKKEEDYIFMFRPLSPYRSTTSTGE